MWAFCVCVILFLEFTDYAKTVLPNCIVSISDEKSPSAFLTSVDFF